MNHADPLNNPAEWQLALVDLGRRLGLLPEDLAGLRVSAPDNYGEPWALEYFPSVKDAEGQRKPSYCDTSWKNLPGSRWGEGVELQEFYSEKLTLDPAEAVELAYKALSMDCEPFRYIVFFLAGKYYVARGTLSAQMRSSCSVSYWFEESDPPKSRMSQRGWVLQENIFLVSEKAEEIAAKHNEERKQLQPQGGMFTLTSGSSSS